MTGSAVYPDLGISQPTWSEGCHRSCLGDFVDPCISSLKVHGLCAEPSETCEVLVQLGAAQPAADQFALSRGPRWRGVSVLGLRPALLMWRPCFCPHCRQRLMACSSVPQTDGGNGDLDPGILLTAQTITSETTSSTTTTQITKVTAWEHDKTITTKTTTR